MDDPVEMSGLDTRHVYIAQKKKVLIDNRWEPALKIVLVVDVDKGKPFLAPRWSLPNFYSVNKPLCCLSSQAIMLSHQTP